MHHAGAEDLEPARPLAHAAARPVTGRAGDVHLGRRLREREEARTEAHLRVGIKELMEAELERPLEIGKGDPTVDHKPLHLREHRGVRRIVGVAAVDAPGRNHANGCIRRALLHRARLYGRGLRAQEDVLRDIERVLHIACGVILRQIQRFEVEVVALDLGPLLDGKAHLQEDRLDAVQRDRERVQMSYGCRASRQGHVNLLGGNLVRKLPRRQFFGLRRKQRLNLGACLVDDLADARALLLCECAHAAEQRGHLALFPEKFHADIVEFTEAARCLRNRGTGALLEFSDLIVHIVLLYVHEKRCCCSFAQKY